MLTAIMETANFIACNSSDESNKPITSDLTSKIGYYFDIEKEQEIKYKGRPIITKFDYMVGQKQALSTWKQIPFEELRIRNMCDAFYDGINPYSEIRIQNYYNSNDVWPDRIQITEYTTDSSLLLWLKQDKIKFKGEGRTYRGITEKEALQIYDKYAVIFAVFKKE